MKKTLLSTLAALIVSIFSANTAAAQFYEIANQLPGLIQPALSGSMNYKGYVEAHYLKGVGTYNADFVGGSTSQGFQYKSWFFMGVGIGVDGLLSHVTSTPDYGDISPDYTYENSRSSAVMVPIFTDFRFTIGNQQKIGLYIDLKVGCSFLTGKDYVRVNNGYLTSQQYFYLRPSLGLRIPTNSKNEKQAVTVGINYQLLTSNYWNRWSNDITLNSIGVALAYEW